MGWLNDATNAIKQGRHDVADEIVRGAERAGDAVAHIGRQMVREARQANQRLPFRGGGGRRTPKEPFVPTDIPAPAPGDFPIISRGGQSTCGTLTAWGGGQPFVLSGTIPVAAGAVTQGTNFASFHLATSNPTIITTDNLIPGNIEVFQAHLSISARLVTTLGFEGIGLYDNFWMVELVNGIEKARWSIRQLACMAGATGITTSGASNAIARLDLPSIPWHRKYDPNVPHLTALQLGRTVTFVSIVDCTFDEIGVRP